MVETWRAEEIYGILKIFEEGRRQILVTPDLFFEFVKFADLDQFANNGLRIRDIKNNYSEWSKLWTFRDIYQAAKRNKTLGSANEFFGGNYAAEFIELVESEDLNFIIKSYEDDKPTIFIDSLLTLNKKWSAAEILTTLKEEHPETWGAFAVQDSDFFETLIVKQDLDQLIITGAKPPELISVCGKRGSLGCL
jgi:hypothetical protein